MIHGFHEDMQIISALSDTPGLPSNELKAKFDEGGVALKSYINESLVPEIEDALDAISGGIDDVQTSLAADIPDVEDSLTSLSAADALSAKQGKLLNDALTAQDTRLTSAEGTLTALYTAVNQKQKTITCGTAAPSGGANGDIYLKY